MNEVLQLYHLYVQNDKPARNLDLLIFPIMLHPSQDQLQRKYRKTFKHILRYQNKLNNSFRTLQGVSQSKNS